MDNLGTLEELPTEYVQALNEQNLVPLWPSLGAVLPADIPTRTTQPTHWSYSMIRPLLPQAGELTPIEKAERRVLVMSNPGHGLDAMKVSPAMYVGMQLLLPGEWAPSHRHTPNAVRMIIEGDGAYTTVDGEKCPMNRGDLILTPSGLWHEHSHDGQAPVVWLDVLDLPLIYFMETSYHNVGTRQTVNPTKGHGIYANGGVLPDPGSLAFRLTVNGEERQNANTKDLVIDIPHLIEFASSFYTLNPGDLIFTGTPEGVGPVEPGDRIEMELEGVGTIAVNVTTMVNDGKPRVSGHIAYRAVLPIDQVPEANRKHAMVIWMGPRFHLVHYPLRQSDVFNLVAVFHSDKYDEGWDTYGDPEELRARFQGARPEVLGMLEKIDSWRMWVLCDRDPVGNWTKDNVTLLGDAAHPMLQYLAQGACMAMEGMAWMYEKDQIPA